MGALAARLDSHTFHAFAKRLIDRFRPVLTGKDALDADYTIGKPRVTRRQIEFEDLVPLAIQILKSSEVARNAVRQTYSHVFLDEFQDCTGQQYELIRIAFHGSAIQLTAVGDTKQRIMGWAGALEGVFKTFADEFKARPLNLYQNFRSLPRLRRMQNAMVKVMDPDAAVPDSEIAGKGGQGRDAIGKGGQRLLHALAEPGEAGRRCEAAVELGLGSTDAGLAQDHGIAPDRRRHRLLVAGQRAQQRCHPRVDRLEELRIGGRGEPVGLGEQDVEHDRHRPGLGVGRQRPLGERGGLVVGGHQDRDSHGSGPSILRPPGEGERAQGSPPSSHTNCGTCSAAMVRQYSYSPSSLTGAVMGPRSGLM